MKEVWRGELVVNDLGLSVQDVCFWSASRSEITLISPNATLRFLSNVHVPSIPFYLAAGPPYEVSTNNDDTALWLSQNLAAVEEDGPKSDEGRKPWWSQLSPELQNGVLLKVEGYTSGHKGTEVLLYAAEHTKEACLPTPSRSSPSPASLPFPDTQEGGSVLFKVYALPLCSDIITRAKDADLRVDEECPVFLSDSQTVESIPNKKQRLSDRFNDATQQRRKLKGRGGEGVSKTMASGDGTLGQPGLRKASHGEEAANLATNLTSGTQTSLSRAYDVLPLPGTMNTRPSSRGALANGKRSSLNRVESALSRRETSVLSESDSSFSQLNKAALTKVVMAGLRLHGLQQKKKRTDLLADGEDEYKLVYHQTFKSAMFTFRAHFSTRLLGQEPMREVVDRLLTLFCTDPTTSSYDQEGFAQPQGAQSVQPDMSYVFDLPSSSASPGAPRGGWSTPATKKRG